MKRFSRPLTWLLIAGLAVICALNYQLFVFPNRFAPAGLNGICTMIQYLFHINVGYLSLIINIPLAALVYFLVGRDMARRSMLFVASFSLSLIILGYVDLSAFAYDTPNGTSRILGPLVAGVINGACYAILVQLSSSSGGTDLVAALIHRKRPELGFFWITFALNAGVAVTSYFVYDFEMEPVILCILYSFLSSAVSDRVTRGRRSAVRCEIITNDPERIAQQIIARLHHTATLVPAKGMYQGHETNILICIINKNQLPLLSDIVSAQEGSFAVISGVSSVLGNFKRYDAHGNLKKDFLDKGKNTLE